MRRIRIHNDIAIGWEILTDGEAVSLEGRSLELYLTNGLGWVRRPEFSVTGNLVSLEFKGQDQQALGRYSLILRDLTEGKMQTIDKVDAFKLVEHTFQEGGDDEERVNIHSVRLTSNVDAMIPYLIPDATPERHGLMSAEDKTLLNDLGTKRLVEWGELAMYLASNIAHLVLENVPDATDESHGLMSNFDKMDLAGLLAKNPINYSDLETFLTHNLWNYTSQEYGKITLVIDTAENPDKFSLEGMREQQYEMVYNGLQRNQDIGFRIAVMNEFGTQQYFYPVRVSWGNITIIGAEGMCSLELYPDGTFIRSGHRYWD